jgi:hypothetical protein
MYLFVRIFERVFTYLYCGLCFGGIAVFAHQIISYLRNGAWKPLSVIDGLLYLTQKRPPDWLLYPQDWIGLHNLLDRTPVSLALIFLGGLVWLVALPIRDKLEQLKQHKELLEDELLTKQQQE